MASLKEKVSRRISTNVEKRISDKQGISKGTREIGTLKILRDFQSILYAYDM